MDYYLNDTNVVNRLVDEWSKYNNLVVAYDFDNTVFDYHNQGQKYDDVIDLLRECKQFGAHLVVFTANDEDKHPPIIDYLKANNIPFDAINENPSFVPVQSSKKIYFNILLDDRAGLSSSYYCLKEVLEIMKSKGVKND
jgi:hydroxymethylpyrimidine pyrophosphatase-like HAD family hydrolase